MNSIYFCNEVTIFTKSPFLSFKLLLYKIETKGLRLFLIFYMRGLNELLPRSKSDETKAELLLNSGLALQGFNTMKIVDKIYKCQVAGAGVGVWKLQRHELHIPTRLFMRPMGNTGTDE